MEDGQKFNRGDAQWLEIRNLIDQTRVRAPLAIGNARAFMGGEAADVHLIDDGSRGRMP